jgi:hypothetical protein
LALYLFLVTVADAEGLSWYAEPTLCRQLSWSVAQLQSARAELLRTNLIAYRQPLYQVLDLAPVAVPSTPPACRGDRAVSVGEVLQQILPALAKQRSVLPTAAGIERGGGR